MTVMIQEPALNLPRREPLFSVVIPVYNAGNFILRTLESVFNQTVQDFEIILINDASTDNTLKHLEKIKDHRLLVFSHSANQGVSAARNSGIKEARGTYIAFLDADDVWLPLHLETAFSFLSQQPQVAWFSSRTMFAEPEEKETLQTDALENGSVHYKIVDYFQEGYRYACSSSVVIRKNCISTENLFPLHVVNGEDWVAWARIAAQHVHMGLSSNVTALYVMHPASGTSRLKEKKQQIFSSYMQLCDYLDDLHPCPEAIKAAARYVKYRMCERWFVAIYQNSLRHWLPTLEKHQSRMGLGLSCWVKLYILTSECTRFLFLLPVRLLLKLRSLSPR